MRADEIMKKDVECAKLDEPAAEAARRMRDRNLGFLPVCDDGGRVVGTITDRDLAIRLVASERPASTQVREVMTREVVACSPTDDLDRVEQLMSQNHKSRILCIANGGRPAGVISLSDIAACETNPQKAADTMKQVVSRELRA